ncbi:MAG: segregation/condensation protein A [Clostridia bacterium]|nr:segregation/condensation protein A [Clostridia bacterium]
MECPTFRLEIFEGPLDLLLHLISKNKVDIYDIPVSEILEQYLAYMKAAEDFNIELASEFSVMAAQLLLIKSSMILPKYEDLEEDPRKQLVESLIEYQLFKATRPYFQERAESFAGSFVREQETLAPIPVAQYGLSPELLSGAVRMLMQRKEEMKEEPDFHMATVMSRNTVSIDEKIGGILTLFKTRKNLSLRSLYRAAKSKSELIATFLAVLELCKDQHILLTDAEDDLTLSLNEEITPTADAKE